MKQATLSYLIKEKNDKISHLCLAMKKRGFGAGRWNGVGGKVGNEKIKAAAVREAKEEINVEIKELNKTAELEFYFPHWPEWNQLVHVFVTKKWSGEPQESEEMKPRWFRLEDIPYELMWSDDIYWLPVVLAKKLIRARFVFKEGDSVKKKTIEIVEKF